MITHNGHEYEIKDLDTLTGVMMMHTWGTILGSNIEEILPVITSFFDFVEGEQPNDKNAFLEKLLNDKAFTDSIRIVSRLLTTDNFMDLCSVMLPGCKVDGKECDASGMCEAFKKQPHLVYIALGLAVFHNYEDYLGPLFQGGDEEEDTTDAPSQE